MTVPSPTAIYLFYTVILFVLYLYELCKISWNYTKLHVWYNYIKIHQVYLLTYLLLVVPKESEAYNTTYYKMLNLL